MTTSKRASMRLGAVLCVFLAGLAAFPLFVGANLLAVDLGAEFLKVSLIKPGRSPISIVANEMSKRKTTAAVSFIGGERLLGEEAAALAGRYPDRVFTRIRDFIGKRADDPTVREMLGKSNMPYTLVEDEERGTIAFGVPDSNATYTAEELLSSILVYTRRIAEAQAEGKVKDTVLVVPGWMGPNQRDVYRACAGLAGLNVLALVNSHSMAALQYGIERNFVDEDQNVIFYDLGSGSAEAALIKYSSYKAKEAGKKTDINQFTVLDAVYDTGVGGYEMDRLLMRHFADIFAARTGVENLLSYPRAAAKLRKAVRRTKEVLSANLDAPCIVEELHDGHDFSASIKRSEFEELAAPLFERAGGLLGSLLERNELKPDDINSVQLLGGASRVPGVLTALGSAIDGKELDRHLDGDEAVVLGGGLFAANMSTMFRLRKFGMADGANYPVTVQVSEPLVAEDAEEATESEAAADGDEDSEEADDPSKHWYEVKSLIPRMKRLPVKRAVHLPNITADPLELTLAFDTAEGPQAPSPVLPPGAVSETLAKYNVTGLDGVREEYGHTGKVTLHFAADVSGFVELTKAEAAVQITELVEVTEQIPEDELTPEQKALLDAVEKAEEEKADEKEPADGSEDGGEDEATPESGEEEATPESDEEEATAESDDAEEEEEDASADAEEAEPEGEEAGSARKLLSEDEGEGEGEEAHSKGKKKGGWKAHSKKEKEKKKKEEKAKEKEEKKKHSEERKKEREEKKKEAEEKAKAKEKEREEKKKEKAEKEKAAKKAAALKKAWPTRKVMKEKKKTKKTVLTVEKSGEVPPPMSGPANRAVANALRQAEAADKEKARTAEAKNGLESFIINVRSDLDYDEDLMAVTTEESRDAFKEALTEMEDWLYMEGDNETADTYLEKFKELRKTADPMFNRAKEHTVRPQKTKKAKDMLDKMHASVGIWPEMKPHLDRKDIAALAKEIKEVQEWLKEKEKEQETKLPTEDPVYNSEQLMEKLNALDKTFNKLALKRPPPPPPPPKADKGKKDGKDKAEKAEEEKAEDAVEEEKAEDAVEEEKAEDAAEEEADEKAEDEETAAEAGSEEQKTEEKAEEEKTEEKSEEKAEEKTEQDANAEEEHDELRK